MLAAVSKILPVCLPVCLCFYHVKPKSQFMNSAVCWHRKTRLWYFINLSALIIDLISLGFSCMFVFLSNKLSKTQRSCIYIIYAEEKQEIIRKLDISKQAAFSIISRSTHFHKLRRPVFITRYRKLTLRWPLSEKCKFSQEHFQFVCNKPLCLKASLKLLKTQN